MQKLKFKNRILIFILCIVTTITNLPINASANTFENHAPQLEEEYKTGILEKEIAVDESFVLNLKKVFSDADADDLTYFVKMGNAEYRKTEYKCMYKPDSIGTVEMTFKANDGNEDSTELKVKLKVVKDAKVPTKFQSIEGSKQSNLLSSLIIHTGVSVNENTVLIKNASDSYQKGIVFDPETYVYELNAELYEIKRSENDEASLISLGFQAQSQNENANITLHWGNENIFDITGENGTSKIKQFLKSGKNEFDIVVSDKNGLKESQTYKFILNVYPTLFSLKAEDGMYLNADFESKTKDYTLSVGENIEEIKFSAVASSEDCQITYNGKQNSMVDISKTDTVEISVTKDGVATNYMIHLDRKKVCDFVIETIPENATVVVYNHLDTKLIPVKDNRYTAMFGEYEYRYTVSAEGYTTISDTVPATGGTVKVELSKVVGKQPDTDVDVDWANFRNSNSNMAITSVKTPRSEDASKVTPKWIRDFSEGKPSIQIIVDNALVVMAGKTLYKLDPETGDILQKAEMVSDTGYGYTPMTYAEGMIFCPLTGGTIQAFHAKTLESLWVYKDPIGGQSLSPITYSDGYIYTGFWTGERNPANFVCMSILDEDVAQKTESKQAAWTYKQNGGFYWAGAVAVGDAVIVGTDDGAAEGKSENSYLYSFDKKNGDVISKVTLQGAGDQRSSIAYSKEDGKVYFTTKGGYLYSAKVNEKNGKLSGLKGKNFGMMSTSTPVVYKNRVYFGVGKSLSSGCFAVADADSLDILFTVDMKGYPQCSMLMTTAYEESTGELYLYSTYNNRPGGLTVIKVKSDCKSVKDVSVTELYNADGYSEFCITSVICDNKGTLYYKNDTGNVFAVGIPSFENVINLIDEIGQVNLESEGRIKAARAAYNALNAADKQKVTNYKELTEAETKYKQLANVNHVIELINAIGKVTIISNEKLASARKAYDLLTASEKLLVTNRAFLTEAEERYDDLVKEAINEVENAIYAIGTVTIDSRSPITKARTLYEELPAHLKEMIHNLDLLVSAENAFKNLLESQKSKKETVEKNSIFINDLDAPTKSKVLVLQEKLKNITENVNYQDAMEIMKDYMALNENGQLALKEMEGMTILQNVIGLENHRHTDTEIIAEGVEWNIRLVVQKVSDQKVLNDVKQKVTDRNLLEMWDISLEDCITGEKYQPQKEVTIKIPLKNIKTLTKNDVEYSILHYADDKKIEIFKCIQEESYVVFDAVEFSYYGILSSDKESTVDEQAIKTVTEKATTGENAGMPWYFWIGMVLAGSVLLVLVVILMKEEPEEETISSS